MKGSTIPDEDHIARYCGFGTLDEDGKIGATAFMLRKDENELSVDWLEFLSCSNREDEIIEIRKVYTSNRSVGTKAKIAILNVGKLRQNVREKLEKKPDYQELQVIHDPLANRPSHSGIHNMKHEDNTIPKLLTEVVIDSPPAKS